MSGQPLKANRKIAELRTCRHCGSPFAIGEDAVRCDRCSTYYHSRCWGELDGRCPSCPGFATAAAPLASDIIRVPRRPRPEAPASTSVTDVAAVAADSADTAYCIFCGESLKRGAIKCSHCGRAVDLRVEGKLEPALPASDSAAEVAPTPVDAGDIKPCSSCGKPIRRDAVKCRHCGSVLDPELRQAQAAALPQGDAPGAGAALGWGIFSIVFILALAFLGFILFWGAVAGPVAIYNGGKALKHISENPAYSGRGKAIAGLVLGIVGTLGSLVTLMGVCNS